jgi:hypothetical protein
MILQLGLTETQSATTLMKLFLGSGLKALKLFYLALQMLIRTTKLLQVQI